MNAVYRHCRQKMCGFLRHSVESLLGYYSEKQPYSSVNKKDGYRQRNVRQFLQSA